MTILISDKVESEAGENTQTGQVNLFGLIFHYE